MSEPERAPRPDKARCDWLDSLKNGNTVIIHGLGVKRTATVIMRLYSNDLLTTGGLVFDGVEGECARRELWIMAAENDE